MSAGLHFQKKGCNFWIRLAHYFFEAPRIHRLWSVCKSLWLFYCSLLTFDSLTFNGALQESSRKVLKAYFSLTLHLLERVFGKWAAHTTHTFTWSAIRSETQRGEGENFKLYGFGATSPDVHLFFRSSNRSIKRKKFDDEVIDYSACYATAVVSTVKASITLLLLNMLVGASLTSLR